MMWLGMVQKGENYGLQKKGEENETEEFWKKNRKSLKYFR